MKPAPFEYHAAGTVNDAISLLGKFAEDGGRIIAGGQSMVPMMAFRLARPSHLIDINAVTEFQHLAVEDRVLRIGATVRHATLEGAPIGGVLERLLREVARFIGHKPIRNRGTLCGSLAHADPAAEWCLVAATLGADIVARSARQPRSIPAAGFFRGVMTTALAPDELVSECRIPVPPDDTRYGFYEVSRRAGDFALAAALVTYRIDAGRMVDPRVGIGGVEPCPRRLQAAEAILAGCPASPDLFRETADAAAAAVDPMADSSNSPAFKRQLVRTVVLRALERTQS